MTTLPLVAALLAAAPAPSAPPPTFTALAAGDGFTCGLEPAGTVLCWGEEAFRHAGEERPAIGTSGLRVAGISDATAIAAGGEHLCVLRRTGRVFCFGNSDVLADGREHHSPELEDCDRRLGFIDGLPAATALASGYEHACAVAADGRVWCWGRDAAGAVSGTDVFEEGPGRAHEVEGVAGAVVLAAGWSHTCALGAGGAVACWGWHHLGDDLGRAPAPRAVPGLTAAAIAAGHGFGCLLEPSGRVQCWGDGTVGQLGRGKPARDAALAPAPVAGLDDAIAIAAGDHLACAVRRSGRVACWGMLDLGPASERILATPADVPDLAGVRAVTIGARHACALDADGAAWCWGRGTWHQLGSDITWSVLPVRAAPAPITTTRLVDGADRDPAPAARAACRAKVRATDAANEALFESVHPRGRGRGAFGAGSAPSPLPARVGGAGLGMGLGIRGGGRSAPPAPPPACELSPAQVAPGGRFAIRSPDLDADGPARLDGRPLEVLQGRSGELLVAIPADAASGRIEAGRPPRACGQLTVEPATRR